VISANLPYVEEKYSHKSIKKEPNLALFSGKKGLDHYERLFFELENKIVDFKFLFLEH
jgi:methylase of polypeptide subunit release factors